MSGVFGLLFLITLIGLVWGLISPSHLARKAKISKSLTRKHTGLFFGLLMIVFLALGAATTPKTVNLKSANAAAHGQATVSTVKATSKPVISTKQVTETQPVSFTTSDENDSTLAKGQTETKQAGEDGIETLTYNVTYNNGQQTNKTLVSTVVTTPAVNQIVELGTYVAPPTPAPTTTTSPAAPTASSQSCTPLSDEGTCYEPGEYCRDSDHGSSGVAGDGKGIICEDNDGWRWEPN